MRNSNQVKKCSCYQITLIFDLILKSLKSIFKLNRGIMSYLEQLNHTHLTEEEISQETAYFNDKIAKILAGQLPVYNLPPQQVRDTAEAGKALWPVKKHPDVQDRLAVALQREVPVRVYIPETVKAVYLDIHGGGFVLGRAHHQDQTLVALANNCSIAAVSVDYRLAPEHPYPAAIDDCETAALWLIENAQKEFGTGTILIGGDSAGANLAVATLLRMRDRHGFTGFSGVNLLFGLFDLTMTPSVKNWGEEPNLVLTTKLIEWFYDSYTAGADKKNPDISPFYADLSNLPPALFSVGTLDVLLDDTLLMYKKWVQANNEAELCVYPGGIHAFTSFPLAIAREAKRRIYEFIIKLV